MDEQFAMDVYLGHYMKYSHHAICTKPRISFDVYQQCLWLLGSHAAQMDIKELIPEPDLLDSRSLDSIEPQSTSGQTSKRAKSLRFEDARSSSGWKSPMVLQSTRPRTTNSKASVPGPGMYMTHIFAPFPNKSIFPGGSVSCGGTKGWSWGTSHLQNFSKDTLQQTKQSPGPAAHGDNGLGMRRPQIGCGTGQLPGSAVHAHFGAAGRRFSVAHCNGEISCELLSGALATQKERAVLRKGDGKLKLNLSGAMEALPCQEQLAEARRVLDDLLRQESLRLQAPPTGLILTVIKGLKQNFSEGDDAKWIASIEFTIFLMCRIPYSLCLVCASIHLN